MILIAQQELQLLRAAAAGGYPEEVCGVLLGRDAGGNGAGREVLRVVPVANARAEQRERRYLIEPRELLAIERDATRAGLEVLGFYHSHPDHPAVPSVFDREHSWPWYTYVIVSVQRGEAVAARAWRLRDDRSGFEEQNIAPAD